MTVIFHMILDELKWVKIILLRGLTRYARACATSTPRGRRWMDPNLSSKALSSFMEKEPFFNFCPVNISKKGLYVIGSFEAIIDHKGMLKDIHD